MTNRKKYQELIEITNAVIFELDLGWNYTSLNNEWTILTGFTVEETIGTSFLSYLIPKDRVIMAEEFRNLLQGEHAGGTLKEIKLCSKQGELKEYHLFLRVDRDHDQKATSFSGTLTILSTRKHNIAEFYKNIQNFQLISENLTDMVAVLAEDGLVLYASPSHTTILGYELEDYIGIYPLKYLHPDDWEKMFHYFHQVVSTWSTLDTEYRTLHKNGSFLELEMKCTPIKGPNGEIQVICLSRDITEKKRAQEELRQATIKFKTLIESLPYGIKVEDEEGTVTLYNDAYIHLFPLKSNEEGPGEANYVMNDAHEYVQEKRKIMKDRQPRRAEEIQLTNGLTIERDAIPMIEDGHFDGYLWIFRDITEEKLARQKLQEANQLLQELSIKDGLTGIANRRCFDLTLQQEWENLAVFSEDISLLLMDIDFFKAFNDLYGHQAGDHCLKQVAGILKNLLKEPQHLAARYGGEEFAILLPGRNTDQAIHIANQIQTALETAGLPHKGSEVADMITLSIGISTKTATAMNPPDEIITEADEALYKAKQNGRNQIRTYQK